MRAGSRHVPARPGRNGKSGGKGNGGGTGSGEGSGGSRTAARLDALEQLAEPVVRAAGMVLEEVQLTPMGRRRLLRVIVDASGNAGPDDGAGLNDGAGPDDGVGLDDIALVSQALSAELDAAGIMGDMPYTLEVTSPGVDRPLTEPRHWRRSVGRMVRVTATGQGRSEGTSARGGGTDGRAGTSGPGGGPGGGGRSDGRGATADGRTRVRTAHVVSGRVIAADDDGIVLDIDGMQRGFGFAELGPGKVQVEFRRDDIGESRGY